MEIVFDLYYCPPNIALIFFINTLKKEIREKVIKIWK